MVLELLLFDDLESELLELWFAFSFCILLADLDSASCFCVLIDLVLTSFRLASTLLISGSMPYLPILRACKARG